MMKDVPYKVVSNIMQCYMPCYVCMYMHGVSQGRGTAIFTYKQLIDLHTNDNIIILTPKKLSSYLDHASYHDNQLLLLHPLLDPLHKHNLPISTPLKLKQN